MKISDRVLVVLLFLFLLTAFIGVAGMEGGAGIWATVLTVASGIALVALLLVIKAVWEFETGEKAKMFGDWEDRL